QGILGLNVIFLFSCLTVYYDGLELHLVAKSCLKNRFSHTPPLRSDMKIDRIRLPFYLVLATIACSLIEANSSWAQKAPPGNPQAPTINPLPTSVQRGVPLDLIVTGTNLTGPTGVSLGIPAKVTIPTEDK